MRCEEETKRIWTEGHQQLPQLHDRSRPTTRADIMSVWVASGVLLILFTQRNRKKRKGLRGFKIINRTKQRHSKKESQKSSNRELKLAQRTIYQQEKSVLKSLSLWVKRPEGNDAKRWCKWLAVILSIHSNEKSQANDTFFASFTFLWMYPSLPQIHMVYCYQESLFAFWLTLMLCQF